MRFKLPSIILLNLFLLGTTFATVAHAGGTGGGENAPSQTPVQVIIQIFLTAIVLKTLKKFDLP